MLELLLLGFFAILNCFFASRIFEMFFGGMWLGICGGRDLLDRKVMCGGGVLFFVTAFFLGGYSEVLGLAWLGLGIYFLVFFKRMIMGLELFGWFLGYNFVLDIY